VRSRRRPGLAALGGRVRFLDVNVAPAINNLTIVPLVAEIGRLCSISDNKLPISAAGA
jgi:hypothetical protein